MTSVSAGHLILIPTQSVGSGLGDRTHDPLTTYIIPPPPPTHTPKNKERKKERKKENENAYVIRSCNSMVSGNCLVGLKLPLALAGFSS